MDLFDHLVDRGWGPKDITSFYLFLDRIMSLPKDLELHYHDHIKIKEKEKKMSYITSAERIGIEKGLHEGMQQGLHAGIDQAKRKYAKKMLEQGLSYSLIENITGLSTPEIESL